MSKKKLLHISLGSHNTGMWRAFDKAFDTVHFDWTPYKTNNFTLNQKVLELFRNFKPDIVFMQIQEGGIINRDTAFEMTKSSVTLNWTGDCRYPIPHWYYELGQHIDMTLFSNMFDVEMFNKVGVNAGFLQVGFDEKIFTPKGSKEEHPQVVFLGSNYLTVSDFPLSNLRVQMVKALSEKYKENFKVFGYNWDELGFGNTWVDQYKEAELYRSADISINLSHFDYGRYSSDRMLRLMGSGGFCLSHNYKDIELDYKIGEHIDVWSSVDELISKIDFYLKNEKEREEIREKGCDFVRENYTWDNVMIELKKLVGYE